MTDKPWLKFYDKGVPHSLAPYPERTLVDVFSEGASQRPDNPAFLFQGASMSNRQVEQLSDSFARALLKQGLEKGDRVALVLPNTPQLLLGLLGTWKAGGIAVPLNPLYTERELEQAFKISGAGTVVTLTPFYSRVKAAQARTKVRSVIATNIKEYLPPVKRILFTLLKEIQAGHRITLQAGDVWLDQFLGEGEASTRTLPRPKPADPAILLFSGGTTGTPKAVLGSHRALFTAGMQYHAWVKHIWVEWQDIGILNMPLFHSYGMAAVLAPGLVGHYPGVLIPDPRNLDEIITTIQKIKPAGISGVPTLYNALVNHPKVVSGKVDLSSLKTCGSGAASLLAETKQRFESVTGARIIEGYGLTESMAAATSNPVSGVSKPNSVGIPLPDVDVLITDVETGLGVFPPGQIGEILIRGPQLMEGFWNQPEETALVLRDGWLYTGDIGYQDEDGYLFIVDRKKDLIKPSGFQVWPREVEEVIATHPAVAEVCVGGIPDAYAGEAVKAWVVLQPGRQASEAELQAHCREKLTGYKVPKVIEFRESLPKSAVGKILRRELAATGRKIREG